MIRRGPWASRTLSTVLLYVLSAASHAAVVTNASDPLRTGWYPDQASLTPAFVQSAGFARRFDTPVDGQVYAQPLVSKGSLLIATEANWVYRIDPENGNIFWSRNLGTTWNPNDLSCLDLTPSIGVTGTPVIDEGTNTVYLFSKTYVSGVSGPAAWDFHAIDLITGKERGNFPVRIQGTAQNNPSQTFDATHELQRPGLLLMDGVVYGGFGGHCDVAPWGGWIVGVSTTGQIKAMFYFRSGTNQSGAAVWHSGGGLVSDGPGRIFVTTGNGGAPSTPIPGNTPPANLGESVVRLAVAGNGTLSAVDFFAPSNAPNLDLVDGDLGSSAPVALPSQYFGTTSYPNLMVQSGKQGFVYLLNRDSLGGMRQGPGAGDNVVGKIGGYGGVWSRAAVWPGDGGYIYIPTATNGNLFRVYKYGVDANDKPTLTLVASSTDAFGFGSSSPVVTSNGAATGSALVWIIYSVDGSGTGAQLRAYDPVPQSGHPVRLYQSPIGISSKFNPPGIGAGRVYVGTRDGHVLSYGPTVISLAGTKSTGNGSVHLQWSGGNTPFTLRRSADANFTSPATLVDHQPSTSYDDPTLNDGNTYFYLVQ